MKLIRIAILYFHTQENNWMRKKWVVRLGDVDISSHKIGIAPEIKDKQRQLIFASTKLEKLPDKTPANYLIVPDTERRKAENAIEAVANMFSVIERCQREISSPTPCIAFFSETNDETEWLESTLGIYAEHEAIPDARFTLELEENLINSLSDRLSGVALLAEALAHTNGYTRDEIKQWVQFRHPATHADLRTTHELVFEADIVRYIPRMEQAAYDLPLDRRNIWSPLWIHYEQNTYCVYCPTKKALKSGLVSCLSIC
jgi:hypothetical protein